ncbi:hypothetical protein [Shimia abyssi]|uniref:Uncharacterized protein n=1 Tax=Shimia abyssi TaxID=1662395 RepID=A0A2P8FBQ0_9RHOB|nr:hypothetical protein [Shimia abyssi]PSL19124.1 hypothetical protein CLV88_10767 [Shimia abyssi]
MGAEILEIDRRLQRFDRRHTPQGLLLRYANGRVRHFAARQFQTLTGAVSLFFLASVEVGLLAVLIALIGEAVDCLYLRRVGAMLDRGESFRRIYVLSSLTAAIQAITISACVVMAWATAPGDAALFFCFAYLTAAVINGGIVLPFHRGAAAARLTVYVIVILMFFLLESL